MQNHSKKILITGAAGFIGSHLVDRLVKQGISPHNLRCMIAPWDSLDNLSQHSDLEVVRLDIRNRKQLIQHVKGCSVIYHLAAKTDFLGKSYEEYEEVNVLPTRWLYEVAAKAGVKKFVFFSSIGVHGLPAGIGPMENWDEDHPATYTNDYGKSKWLAEEAIRSLFKKHKLAYTIIRPASVYGPREKGPTLALYRAINRKQFVIIGSGENLLHYVYVEDIVMAAITAACSNRSSGEYIIAGPKPVSLNTVADHIAGVCGVSIWPVKIPLLIAQPLSWVIEKLAVLVGIPAPIYPERVRTMTTSYYFSIKKSEKELEFSPKIDFKLGSRITGVWYRIKGWL